MPAAVADLGCPRADAADHFGPKRSGAIYGTMLTAWSVGGLLGPLLIAQVIDRRPATTLQRSPSSP
ncbi:MAG: hypothetical protein ACXVCO_11925 [Ktedonobacterales bacterium]